MNPDDLTRRNQDAHCRRPGCYCTHDGGCYRGWIDPIGDPPRTIPCATCRPEATRRTGSVPPPGQRNPSDLWTLRNPRGV